MLPPSSGQEGGLHAYGWVCCILLFSNGYGRREFDQTHVRGQESGIEVAVTRQIQIYAIFCHVPSIFSVVIPTAREAREIDTRAAEMMSEADGP